jgi:phenylalanyl-tRNA synthetase beta chain
VKLPLSWLTPTSTSTSRSTSSRRRDEPARARGRGGHHPRRRHRRRPHRPVLDWAPHPDADKLRVVHVTGDGGDGEIELVCGASNFDVGDVVATPPGPAIPGTGPDGPGLTLEARADPRGGVQRDAGLARELELGDDHDGILVLPPTTPARGRPHRPAAARRAGHRDRRAGRPRRPPVVLGVARDLAAILDTTWHAPEVPDPAGRPHGPGHARHRRLRVGS